MRILYAAISEAGLREGENQDCIFCATHKDGGVFLVADGMGGHENGRLASQTVREEIRLAWEASTSRSHETMHSYLLDETLKEALKKANKRIRKETAGGGMSGSTAVVLRISENGYGILNCGDSRCLHVRKSLCKTEVRQLTKDDVWENIRGNIRGMSGKEVKANGNCGKLLRAVGTEVCFSCDIVRDTLQGTSLFALCSDGVYKYLNRKKLEGILKESCRGKGGEMFLMQQVERVREMVYENGAPDNFSLILVLAEAEN